MASVNDYGKDELANLAAPKLGGTDGWAAAVAAVVNESDVTVDDRIYNAISSSPRGSRWLWGGSDADVAPLPGHFAIENTGGSNRKFAMSNTDADGYGRSAATLMAGDTVTVTDDPAAPPVTGFARYVIVDDPVEHTGYWTWNAIRTDTSGTQTIPALDTSLRMNATWSGSTGELYVKRSGDTMTGALKFNTPSGVGGALSSTVPETLGVYSSDLQALAPLYVAMPTSHDQAAPKQYVDNERTKLFATNAPADVTVGAGEWAGLIAELNIPAQPTSFIALITGIVTFDCLALTWASIKVDNVQFGNQYNSPGKEPVGGGRGQVTVQAWYAYPANQAMNVRLDGGYATSGCTLKAGSPLSVIVIPT